MINPFSTRTFAKCCFGKGLACCVILIAIFAGRVHAQVDSAPSAARAALQQVAQEMVVALQDPSVRRDIKQIRQLVDRLLVPQIDFRVSANLVLGPHWAAASEPQRSAFIEEFQAFLVRFYAGALASYLDADDLPIDIMSFEEQPRIKDERQLIVRSYVGQANGDNVRVDYRMFLRDTWKIIDVSVGGISMIKSYRSNFTSTVKQQGLDVLIAQLQERNQFFSAN